MNAFTMVVGTLKNLSELTETERGQLKALHKELIDYEYQFTPKAMQYVFNQLETVDQSLEEIIQNIDFVYYLTRSGTKEMIAFLAVDKGDPYQIAGLYVQEQFRNNAFGAVMVARFAQICPLNPITVNCFRSNTRAKSFYEGMGFKFSSHCREHEVHHGVRPVDAPLSKLFPIHALTPSDLRSHMTEEERKLH